MKSTVCIAGLLFVHSMLSAQVTLTGFGTGQFTVDSNSTTAGSLIQTATTIDLSINDQTGTFAGTFAPVNISGLTTTLLFTATVSNPNPNSGFRVDIFDSTLLRIVSYNGNWSSFATGTPTTVALTSSSMSPGFDPTTVQGFQLGFGGVGSTLTISLDSLATSAVPEPSAYAGALAACALGATVLRKRRWRQ